MWDVASRVLSVPSNVVAAVILLTIPFIATLEAQDCKSSYP